MKTWKSFSVIAAFLLAGSGCDFGDPIKETGGGTGVEGLTGALVVAGGFPVAGAWVRVYSADGSSALARRASAFALDSMQTNGAGAFGFPDLPDGTYNLAASAQRGDTTLALYLAGIVVSGKTDLGVDTLRIAGGLSVQVQADNAALSGALCTLAGGAWQAVSDGSGTCVITGVPPGTFQVTIPHASHQITVSGNLVVISGTVTPGGIVNVGGTAITPPAAPVLVSPASFATAVPINAGLAWRQTAGAASFHAQVATDSAFVNKAVNDSGVIDTVRAVGPLAGGTRYYWRVRAKNTAGVGPWSAQRSFVTAGTAVIASASLVAHWNFDETSGATVNDRTGKGHDGTVVGVAAWTQDGVAGGSLHFNGSTHVEVPASEEFSSLRSFTLSAWIWQDNLTPDRPVLEFAQPAAFSGVHLWVNSDGSTSPSAGRVYGNLRSTGQPSYYFSTAAGLSPAGQWNHLVMTFDSTTRAARLFVNGAPSASYSMPAGITPSLAGSLFMGWRPSGSLDWQAGYSFTGRMDEVALYGKALTGAEVSTLYNATKP